MLSDILYSMSSFIVPLGILLFFLISLIRYLKASKGIKNQSEKYDGQDLQERRIMLIISSVLLGAMLFVVIAFILLIMMAVAFM